MASTATVDPTETSTTGAPKTNKAPGQNGAAESKNDESVVEEVNRIMQCDANSYHQVLGLSEGASGKEIRRAWKRLGCKIHELYHTGVQNVGEANTKLLAAAEALGVDHTDIGEVQYWDGEENLVEEDDDDESMKGLEDVEIDPPIPPISKIYKNVTPMLGRLCYNPTDAEALATLKKANDRIKGFTNAHKKATKNDKIIESQWMIPIDFFVSEFVPVLNCTAALAKNPDDEDARAIVAKGKATIDQVVKKRHFPDDWLCPTAETLAGKKQDSPPDPPKSDNKNAMAYPWLTHTIPDKGLIIGARKIGKAGTQVCVETVSKDGRTVRRLDSASNIGLVEVKNYTDDANHKNLAAGQANWTHKQRKDFKELHWVTLSHIKRKNKARGPRSPPTDCCVEFLSAGLQMLTLSSLERVLGETTAHAKVTEVCERDGILPPWKRAPLGEYHDESSAKPKKSAVERWEMEDALGQVSSPAAPSNGGISATKGESFKDSRVDSIASDMADLKKQIKLLTETLQALAKSGKSEASLFVQNNSTDGEVEEEL